MRKTLCLGCKKIWEESREIPIEQSQCPNCGRKVMLDQKYCDYCKKRTPHQVIDPTVNKEGTGGDLKCTVCGSARLGTIQGFDASLM